MKRAIPIIETFGGLTATARAVDAPVTTVQRWRDTDRIPHWREHQVRLGAKREGVSLPPDWDDQPNTAA